MLLKVATETFSQSNAPSWANTQRREKEWSLAVMNTQSAMPFAKFAGMFTDQFHPGIEAGIGFNWKTKPKHDWFQEFKAGYFFHRFVQHAIPVYTDFGYRYKFSKRLASGLMIGVGYLHSIPATAKFKLDNNGDYKNNKGIGRMQAMASFGLQLSFTMNPKARHPFNIFSRYQQQIQMPFVKSYVPLLPYNSFMIGLAHAFKSK
jgi:hypothetical protein